MITMKTTTTTRWILLLACCVVAVASASSDREWGEYLRKERTSDERRERLTTFERTRTSPQLESERDVGNGNDEQQPQSRQFDLDDTDDLAYLLEDPAPPPPRPVTDNEPETTTTPPQQQQNTTNTGGGSSSVDRNYCPSLGVQKDEGTIAEFICKNEFMVNLCEMIKMSPPIFNLLNDRDLNGTDWADLEEIPSFNATQFRILVDSFTDAKGVRQYTVFAPDNDALRAFTRETIKTLTNIDDPELVASINQTKFNIEDDGKVDDFILSPQGRICRYKVLMNHMAVESTDFDSLDCDKEMKMWSTENTQTKCDDNKDQQRGNGLDDFGRFLQDGGGGEYEDFISDIGTSKVQLGSGNVFAAASSSNDTNATVAEPRITDPNYLMRNGFVHVVSNVVQPVVEPEIIIQFIELEEEVVTVETTTVFEECDCPICEAFPF